LFLYNRNELNVVDKINILRSCKDLHLALDVSRMDLFEVVQMLRNVIPKNCTSLKAQKYTINNIFTKIYPDMI
jgi:hypothetical protein